MTIRIVLADDHPVVRQGLRRMLEADPEFQIIAEAGDGPETVKIVAQETPDVAIVDLMMPGLNGLEVTRQVTAAHPTMRVIILSMHQDEAYVLQALRRGARGYVLKDSNPGDLAEAVRQVFAGNFYLSEKLSSRLTGKLDSYVTGSLAPKPPDSPQEDSYESLTEREKEVLRQVMKGLTSAEVAQVLSISPRTVEVHRASIMRKLNTPNQIELIRYMIKRGLLPVDR